MLTDNGRRLDNGTLVYYKLTYEPLARVSLKLHKYGFKNIFLLESKNGWTIYIKSFPWVYALWRVSNSAVALGTVVHTFQHRKTLPARK